MAPYDGTSRGIIVVASVLLLIALMGGIGAYLSQRRTEPSAPAPEPRKAASSEKGAPANGAKAPWPAPFAVAPQQAPAQPPAQPPAAAARDSGEYFETQFPLPPSQWRLPSWGCVAPREKSAMV